jgi:hypothetical protein
MRARFLPTTYKRDLKKKLQRLNQGNNSVNDYYQELQITMLCSDVQERDEDKMVRFHSGLCQEIQDIVDYKEYNTTNRLLHLALLAEKELQGRQQVARNIFGANSATKSTSGQAKTAPSSANKLHETFLGLIQQQNPHRGKPKLHHLQLVHVHQPYLHHHVFQR